MNQNKSYHFGQSDIPDTLIEELQKIFTDPAIEDKATSAKQAIFLFASKKIQLEAVPAPVLEGTVNVTKEQLEQWLVKIKAHNQLVVDLESDIGWISETVHNLIHSPNIMKMVPKIILGRIKIKELGLDDERLEHISKKYAPKTHEVLQSKKTKK